MEWVRPCKIAGEGPRGRANDWVEEDDESFQTSQTGNFPYVVRQRFKNLLLTVESRPLSLDLLRPFKGLAGESGRKLPFAGKN
jgi:hypothetical protein